MKKIFNCFVFFCLLFLGTNLVHAERFCEYRNENLDSEFQLRGNKAILVQDFLYKPSYNEKFEGEPYGYDIDIKSNYTQKQGASWKMKEYKDSEKCPKYLYYKIRDNNFDYVFGSDKLGEKFGYNTNGEDKSAGFIIYENFISKSQSSTFKTGKGSLECVYKDGEDTYTYTIKTDGENISMDFKGEVKSDTSYNFKGISNIIDKMNFYSSDDNKLKCLPTIYRSKTIAGASASKNKPYKYTLYNDHELFEFKENDKKIVLDSENSEGNISLNNKSKVFTCQFPIYIYANVTVSNDKVVSVEYFNKSTQEKLDYKDLMNQPEMDEYIYKDSKLTCPLYKNNKNPGDDYYTFTEDRNDENLDSLLNDDNDSSNDNTALSEFSKLMGDVKTILEIKSPGFTYNEKIGILYYKNYSYTQNICSASPNSANYCGNAIDYNLEKGIKNIYFHCNSTYNKYASEKTKYNQHVKECLDFDKFYNHLVQKGIVADYSSDCGILSDDFKEILMYILDLIKIAGPILALGLGILDFIKVVASGDADKEMKTAFKKFSIRILAAILLFLIPIIIAFLLDTFLGNKSGYNEDNPFCDVVDWDE